MCYFHQNQGFLGGILLINASKRQAIKNWIIIEKTMQFICKNKGFLAIRPLLAVLQHQYRRFCQISILVRGFYMLFSKKGRFQLKIDKSLKKGLSTTILTKKVFRKHPFLLFLAVFTKSTPPPGYLVNPLASLLAFCLEVSLERPLRRLRKRRTY